MRAFLSADCRGSFKPQSVTHSVAAGGAVALPDPMQLASLETNLGLLFLRTFMRTKIDRQLLNPSYDWHPAVQHAAGGADAQPGQISTNTQEWSGLVAYNGFAAGTDTASMPIAAG